MEIKFTLPTSPQPDFVASGFVDLLFALAERQDRLQKLLYYRASSAVGGRLNLAEHRPEIEDDINGLNNSYEVMSDLVLQLTGQLYTEYIRVAFPHPDRLDEELFNLRQAQQIRSNRLEEFHVQSKGADQAGQKGGVNHD